MGKVTVALKIARATGKSMDEAYRIISNMSDDMVKALEEGRVGADEALQSAKKNGNIADHLTVRNAVLAGGGAFTLSEVDQFTDAKSKMASASEQRQTTLSKLVSGDTNLPEDERKKAWDALTDENDKDENSNGGNLVAYAMENPAKALIGAIVLIVIVRTFVAEGTQTMLGGGN